MKYDLITSQKIKYYLRTHTFGQKTYAFWSVGSTNEFACQLARRNEQEGTIVIAEEQSSGRGRLKRKWHSQFGLGLWFSIILRPPIQAIKAGFYPYLAGVSVAQAIENKIGLKPSFKWPNDLHLNNKKFCGILSEVDFIDNRVNFIILGIGINVDHKRENFPKELLNYATSLRIEARAEFDRITLLAEIIYLLEKNYYVSNEYGFEMIIQNWKKRCPSLGENIHIIQGDYHYYGKFENLDENGCLLLRTEDGSLKKIVAGDFI